LLSFFSETEATAAHQDAEQRKEGLTDEHQHQTDVEEASPTTGTLKAEEGMTRPPLQGTEHNQRWEQC